MTRICRSEGITDQQLAEAIADAERGLIDADLGGGIIKQRIARPGQGKSGGWRTIIGYRAKQRAVFVYGFAKSQLDNISAKQIADLKITAAGFLTASDTKLAAELARETLKEVPYGKKD